MRRAAPALVALLASLTACHSSGASPARRSVTVFAASSLTRAFEDIGARFERAHPGTTVDFNFAASDTLARQLTEGGPADVFASASAPPMDDVAAAGLAQGKPVAFVTNRLIVVTPSDNPAHIERATDLAQPGVKVVLAAPGVPAGDYARTMFTKLGDLHAVLNNVVSNEVDDSSVVSKVASGEADAGVVYTSDVSPGSGPALHSVAIPPRANVLATYSIAVLRGGPDPSGGRLFVDAVRSDDGARVLRRYGFGIP